MVESLKQAGREFLEDDCQTLAAALAYYTVFALPPLLFIIIVVAGLVVGREAVQAAIQQQAQTMIGGGTAGQVGTMIDGAGQTSGPGAVAMALSVLGILLGATSAFTQLQTALNRAWKVRSESGGIRGFLGKRLLSLLMVMALAMLVLASIALSAWVAAVGDLFGVPGWMLHAAEFAVSLIVMFGLFAAVFKYLPDASVEWSDVATGALVTAALFEVGRFLLGIYLGMAGASSTYGAAGSLALILLFIYYSSMLVLYGAEFTHVWAKRHGKSVRPARGAVLLPETA
jgi:membrane protein